MADHPGKDRYEEEPDDRADESRGVLARAAETVVDTVAQVATQAGAAAGRLVSGRRARREPILNLFDLHPDARSSPRRDLGVLTIPVDQIRGTAVEGDAQRGADFLPLPSLRGSNWRGRWQRLRAAQERLLVLPPIDALQTEDGYWVLDGHNRVALARQVGQDDIDAAVTHVHLPGSSDEDLPQGSLESVATDSLELRAAARARPAGGPAQPSTEATLTPPTEPPGPS